APGGGDTGAGIITGQGQDIQGLAGVHMSWYDCIPTLGNACRSAVQPKKRSKTLSHKGNSSQHSLSARAFDGTSSLTRNGADGNIAPSRSKPMPFRKASTGW